jgi:hypothetical protein
MYGERRKEKEVSNWAKELGCVSDRAGPMTEADGLSGKKIKWADLIFEFCFLINLLGF